MTTHTADSSILLQRLNGVTLILVDLNGKLGNSKQGKETVNKERSSAVVVEVEVEVVSYHSEATVYTHRHRH